VFEHAVKHAFFYLKKWVHVHPLTDVVSSVAPFYLWMEAQRLLLTPSAQCT